jgi:hypothetical protein
MGFKRIKLSTRVELDADWFNFELEYELEEGEDPTAGMERCRMEFTKYKEVLRAAEVLGDEEGLGKANEFSYNPISYGPHIVGHTVGITASVSGVTGSMIGPLNPPWMPITGINTT